MRPLARVLVLASLVACSSTEQGTVSGSAEPLLAESDRHSSDGVLGAPARRPNGELIVARRGSEPGESDLYLEGSESLSEAQAKSEAMKRGGGTEPRSTAKRRSIAPAPGPDELPIALPDGRIAFVSGRTTVASLFIVDPETGAVEQLTNRGLVAGRPWRGFVPPPARDARVVDGALEYDDGSGQLWRVDLRTGAARSLGGGR